MPRYISAQQYKKLTGVPRGRLSVRTQIFCGSIITKRNQVLLVKSYRDSYPGWDFPGGKLLWCEALLECLERETLEETGFQVIPEKVLGIYQRRTQEDEDDYFRFIYICRLKNTRQRKFRDPNIIEAKWFPIKEVISNKLKVRSPEIIREINDFAQGKSFPLDVIDLYTW
jgi:ADP-ribose pyrophosphatase YjhB (NUDIX family)